MRRGRRGGPNSAIPQERARFHGTAPTSPPSASADVGLGLFKRGVGKRVRACGAGEQNGRRWQLPGFCGELVGSQRERRGRALHNQELCINAPFFIPVQGICSRRAGSPDVEGCVLVRVRGAHPPYLLCSPGTLLLLLLLLSAGRQVPAPLPICRSCPSGYGRAWTVKGARSWPRGYVSSAGFHCSRTWSFHAPHHPCHFSLTSASPHPALGDHLPFCYLHPSLCAGSFKALFFFLKLSSFTLLPPVLLFPMPFPVLHLCRVFCSLSFL